jgi:Transposase, Mutator family
VCAPGLVAAIRLAITGDLPIHALVALTNPGRDLLDRLTDGKVANRPIYLALAVTVDGERDLLGLWAGEHGDGKGAKFS